MIKTAIEVSSNRASAAMHSYGTSLQRETPKTANASSGRFPPIENALLDIIKNTRLEEAKRDV